MQLNLSTTIVQAFVMEIYTEIMNIEHQTLMNAIAIADRKLMMVNNSSQFISYLSCENSIKKLPKREYEMIADFT